MNWTLICQWGIFVLLMLGLFMNIEHEIEGRPAKAAGGFFGVVCVMLITALVGIMYWRAGALPF